MLGSSKQHGAILQPMVKPYLKHNFILHAFMFLPPLPKNCKNKEVGNFRSLRRKIITCDYK